MLIQMKRMKKIFFLSVLFPAVLFLGFELSTSIFLFVKQGNIQPLYYGLGESQRVLFEDKAEILKKQGTFLYKEDVPQAHSHDLTQGEIFR